jgi:hypothetical protein
MVPNQVEEVMLRQHHMQVSPLNYIWGQHGDWASFKSQKRYMKKNIKSLLSVSLAAIELPSTTKTDISLDSFMDVREDSGDSDSLNSHDLIPSMDGIPPNTFCWHGGTSEGSLSFLYTAAPPFLKPPILFLFSWYTYVIPLT